MTKKCPICGASNPDDAAICRICGAPFEKKEASSSEQPPAAEPAKPPTSSRQHVQPPARRVPISEDDLDDDPYDESYREAPDAQGIYSYEEDEPESVGPFRPILAGAALTLLLFLTGALLLFIFDQMGIVIFAPAATETLTPSTTSSATLTDTATLTPFTPTNTLTLTPTVPTDTPTPEGPTSTPTITLTPTMAYAEHTISADDTLYYILQLYGHKDISVGNLVVEMNPNVRSIDQLPAPGSTIRIPLPTPTGQPTVPVATDESGEVIDNPAPAGAMAHTIDEDETIIIIALRYKTSLAVLKQLNPQISFASCDMTLEGGGAQCNPQPFRIGDTIWVPAPTPTPTLSPTPSGQETPTFTPTFGAPPLLRPQEGASFANDETVTLRWITAGVLDEEAGEVYRVLVEDTTTTQVYSFETRDTFYELDELRPSDDVDHIFAWRVIVAREGEEGPVGGDGQARRFTWQAP